MHSKNDELAGTGADTPTNAFDASHGKATAEQGDLEKLSLAAALPVEPDKSAFAPGAYTASGGDTVPAQVVPASIKVAE